MFNVTQVTDSVLAGVNIAHAGGLGFNELILDIVILINQSAV
jgi:hypothetical protein